MIFPSVADIAVAMQNATFGFPEIRRGVLPGVVSVHARHRLTDKQCKRFMLTADTFDAADAACMGFVDHVLNPDNDDVESYLKSLVKHLCAMDNLKADKTTIDTTGDLNVASVEMGESQIYPVDSVSNQWRLDWVTSGVVQLSFANETVSFDSVIDFEVCCRRICDMSNVRAVVLVIPQNQDNDLIPASVVESSTLFESRVAGYYQITAAFHKALQYLQIPVLAVLSGPAQGFLASLALSSDWRIATSGSTLHLCDHQSDLFLVRTKSHALCRMDKKRILPLDMTVSQMLNLNLISSFESTFEEALEVAQDLARTISEAPSEGVFSSMKILRNSLPSQQDMADNCVSCVRATYPEKMLSQPFAFTYGEDLTCLQVSSNITALDLLTKFQQKVVLEEPLCLALEDSSIDLSHSEAVLELCDLLMTGGRKPQINLVLKGIDFPLV